MKLILISADQDLLQMLLSDSYYYYVFGMLECIQGCPNLDDDEATSIGEHRKYLASTA